MVDEEAQVSRHPQIVLSVESYTGTKVEVDFTILYPSPHGHPSQHSFSGPQLSAPSPPLSLLPVVQT